MSPFVSRKAAALVAGVSLALVTAACTSDDSPTSTVSPTSTTMAGMDMDSMEDAPTIPAGLAYAEGQEIRFVHTEVSDEELATLLSNMMSSPVLLVPSLAEVPESSTAPVYVFTNGPTGMGPLGFQPDVFPYPPGDAQYTPLRSIHLVTWVDPGQARELKSAAEVQAAEQDGDVTIEKPGAVVNMPFVTWPNGQR
jgi:hypothetical protein